MRTRFGPRSVVALVISVILLTSLVSYTVWSNPGSSEIAIEQDSFYGDLYTFEGVFWHTLFESLDGYGADGEGSAGITQVEIDVSTNGSTDDEFYLYKSPEYRLSLEKLTWAKSRRFKTRIQVQEIASSTKYVCMGYAMVADPTTSHVGFKIVDNAIYGSVGNGTAETLTSSMHTIIIDGVNDCLLLEAVFNPEESSVTFKVTPYGGTQKTATLASGYPTANDGLSETILIWLSVQSSNAGVKTLWCAEWMFLQEP